MENEVHSNHTTMLGTYSLDGNVPVDPEIVLVNCHDTAMLGQLVSAFSDNPDVRFFLIQDIAGDSVDLGADFHFLRDGGTWVLANNDRMIPVHFDDAGFNPSGSQETFSLVRTGDGSFAVVTDAMAHAHLAEPSEQLLVDMAEEDLFINGHEHHANHFDTDGDTLFVDPSVLDHSEIVVSNFTFGSNHLGLPEGVSIKGVVVDNEHDLTEVVIGHADHTSDDIVVKLLGVSQPDLPVHEYGMEGEQTANDLINHLIHSGLSAG